MREESVNFISDNIALDGSFYKPDTIEDNTKPIMLVCSGYTGMKEIHPARFARFFTKEGFISFGFDYRGFGKSKGTKNKVLIEEQIRDIANAVTFVKSVYPDKRIVIAGWGMSGGMIIESAKLIKEFISGLVCMNGFYNNIRVQKELRGTQEFNRYKQWLQAERLKNVNGKGEKDFDPFDIYPLDKVSREYVFSELVKTEGYGIRADFDFADSLMLFNCENDLSHLNDIPVLIAHGAQNKLHPITEANSIYEKYPNSNKELFLLQDGGHTEWMLDTNPKFIEFASKITSWANKL